MDGRFQHPVHGVNDLPDRTTVLSLIIATKGRLPWLACDEMHDLLRRQWLDARGWLVGYYLIMPDHLHLFATRGDLDIKLERWTHYWKRNFTRSLPVGHPRLQDDHWDTRMRNGKHFSETWDYIRRNPVRKGLVSHPDAWPYQGTIWPWNYIGP